ncbi:polysaccharide export protein [Tateyamaria omphalii]|uniref:polysaccharide biosynthesis/export family protein n=1 Tax=Tateyamaria omphalii TaxID=299262 RepID=UPI001C99CFA5|nr:polysaccharide biosynthesis/export family protein [Tateyamaria omphalii]MBY5931955.1 polysaccharide export protein [Tateyamaria omphalii]
MKSFRRFIAIPLVIASVALAACTPSDGPSPRDVRRDARAQDVPILSLNASVINALGTPRVSDDFSGVSRTPYTPGIIRPGDVISVQVFEDANEGMFSVDSTSSISLGDYTVSPGGTVTLPFVGTVRVAGNSAVGAQRIISRTLSERAVDPQATVTVSLSATDNYTVQGNVAAGGTYGLTPRGETLLDALAAAGGAQGDPNQTTVTVRRGAESRSTLLASIIADPSQNIPLRPGDAVIVGGGEASFIADGALSSPGEFTFAEGALSLGQAIAKAGGLQDSRANPNAVYVFRRMPVGESFVLERPSDGERRRITNDVIFHADYSSPTGRLNASDFMLRDGDVVYVGNAPLAQFLKFFRIFENPPEVPAPPTL